MTTFINPLDINPIDMEAFENAVHAWFSSASGLFTIWQEQGAPQPDYPYGSLKIISGPTALAPQWEIRQTYDAARPLGQEIKFEYAAPCRFTVSCQAYAKQGALPAVTYINRAMAALSTITTQTTFKVAGVAMERYSAVRNIGKIINETWLSRANIDVQLTALLLISEYTGYVTSVGIESTELGIDFTI